MATQRLLAKAFRAEELTLVRVWTKSYGRSNCDLPVGTLVTGAGNMGKVQLAEAKQHMARIQNTLQISHSGRFTKSMPAMRG